jgi:hypothetical protein
MVMILSFICRIIEHIIKNTAGVGHSAENGGKHYLRGQHQEVLARAKKRVHLMAIQFQGLT